MLDHWRIHPLKLDHINLNKILYNGQSFRWRWYYHDESRISSSLNAFLNKACYTESTEPIKIHYNSVRLFATDTSHIIKLCQLGDNLYYATPDSHIIEELESFLASMLQLNINRLSLYHSISKLDKHLEKLLLPHLTSLDFKNLECTIMKLPPWETLLSFICSSNNNISRISAMCHKLGEIGGEIIDEIEVPVYDDNELIDYQTVPIYSFPSCDVLLKKCDENMLKEAKFGYRAKYIMQTLQLFHKLKKSQGFEHLSDAEFMGLNISPFVNEMTYRDAKEWLIQFSGCGPKVADCVLLYCDVTLADSGDSEDNLTSHTSDLGKNWNSIIPIDAHITRIALRDFPHIVKKNQKNLDLMRESLMKKFGNFGGWIQVLLFTKEIEGSVKQLK